MKKAIVLLILLAACKQTETTNETTTTMTVTESSATVATVAPTDTTPTTATAAIQTMGTNPAAKPVTATTATAPSTAAPAPAPVPVPAPPSPATAAIETMGTNPAATPPPTIASEGMSVFKSHGCNVCHGTSGAGDTPMGKAKNIPDFHSAAVQNTSDADLVKIIRDAPQHKAKGLSEEQATAVVAWIRTLK